MRIVFHGGEKHIVSAIKFSDYLPLLVFEDGEEYFIAQDPDMAGKAASRYWEDLAENHPDEFVAHLESNTVVRWVLEVWHNDASSFKEWLDDVYQNPAKTFAEDEAEIEVSFLSQDLIDALGFTLLYNVVAYQHN